MKECSDVFRGYRSGTLVENGLMELEFYQPTISLNNYSTVLLGSKKNKKTKQNKKKTYEVYQTVILYYLKAYWSDSSRKSNRAEILRNRPKGSILGPSLTRCFND